VGKRTAQLQQLSNSPGRDGYVPLGCSVCGARWIAPPPRIHRPCYFPLCPACGISGPPGQRLPSASLKLDGLLALGREGVRAVLRFHGFRGPAGEIASEGGEEWSLDDSWAIQHDEPPERWVTVSLHVLGDGHLHWIQIRRFRERVLAPHGVYELSTVRAWAMGEQSLAFHVKEALKWLGM